MRKNILWLAIGAALVSACATNGSTNYGELAEMEFEAWAKINRQPGWEKTELGSYILEMNDNASGASVGSVDDYPYAMVEYTISDLQGNISATTSARVAQQLGTYASHYYYGPTMTYRGTSNLFAGVAEVFDRMHVGGSVKVAIPGWLLTASRHDTKQQYLDAMEESTSAQIYEFKIIEMIEDTDEWEIARLEAAMGSDFAKADSLDYGLWWVCDRPASVDTVYSSSDKVYINYICRRIDGQGVDTNIADSAKVFGTYNSSSSYEPVVINWGDEASDLTMGSDKSSVISGFSTAIYNMQEYEKGRAYMISSQAYSTSGSGSAIPGYCPLIFEIEIVEYSK